MITRVLAVTSLLAATLVVAFVLLFGGSQYTLRANFQDAGGLVAGDQVLIGPSVVGTIKSIGLTSNGEAEVKLTLDSDASPVPEGTIARIYQNSLSGLANKYVVLELGPRDAPRIPDGGTIDEAHTRSPVNLDQLFDTLDPATRQGLRGFIRGNAARIEGKSGEANRTLKYFAPALASTSEVTAELTRDEPEFDGLLVQGAQAMSQLASRAQQLSDLVTSTNATTAAIAAQSQALQQTLQLAPHTFAHTVSTFLQLNKTFDALDPFIAASKPASRRLAQFSASLNSFAKTALPTVTALAALIHNPNSGGDLTQLLLKTPTLAHVATGAFPRLIKSMNDTQSQLNYFREYTPDIVAAFTNLGQAGGYYDANGHYVRTQPVFNAFVRGPMNELEPMPAFVNRFSGFQIVHGRCPGGAIQPSPDGSAPWAVSGCNAGTTPPGP